MHQHPRPPPRTAASATSPRTNPSRTNNSREDRSSSTSTPLSEEPTYRDTDSAMGTTEALSSAPSKDAIKKLDQIVQNFYTKAAIVIMQSRISLPVIFTKDNNRKVNRWFQLETDDTDAYRDELRLWKTCGSFENRPPPLIVEVFLDTSGLTRSQSLVVVDEQGKRWDVMEALRLSGDTAPATEVILERWKIELQPQTQPVSPDFGAILPTVYKKSIVFFRSLYATSKFVPGWRFAKTLAKTGSSNAQLRINCRVLNGSDFRPSQYDTLKQPLHDNDTSPYSDYVLGETDTPAGKFLAEVTYRNDCSFRVDDSEALLSSHFMGVDERNFRPSLTGLPSRQSTKTVEVGSLPANRRRSEEVEPIQAYGSLSTFHGDAPLGSSPISALRAQKPIGSDTSSPSVGSVTRMRSLREGRDMPQRRPSVSFQPFKAGSLSGSSLPGTPVPASDGFPPPSPQAISRTAGISAIAQARNRSSLTAGMPATLRGAPPSQEPVVGSFGSSSPKPTTIGKYSSSFTHRRGRSSFGGASKVDDDQGSSGKQSLSSSVAHPGSGILAEGGGSSGSLQTDDDNISEFLKLLDTKKTLKSLEPSNTGESSAKRTSAQLSRFQLMRDSHHALADSMTSSLQLHRSSSSSSRQLSSVPPMVAGASISTSSSPGKPISPHTPHTPAIPSRLSANSVAEYSPQTIGASRRSRPTISERTESSSNPGAIDIPTSPRPYYTHNRRSSSVAQQHRAMPDDEDLGEMPFGAHRSISLGADDREPPSLSALLGLASDATQDNETQEDMLPTAEEPPASDHEESSPVPRGSAAGSSHSPYRPRIGHTGARGLNPSQPGSYSGSGTSDRPAGRNSLTRPGGFLETDDEPLLFDMSEIGRGEPRRSIDDTHSGAYDSPRGGGDSSSSSRRGSRRGW